MRLKTKTLNEFVNSVHDYVEEKCIKNGISHENHEIQLCDLFEYTMFFDLISTLDKTIGSNYNFTNQNEIPVSTKAQLFSLSTSVDNIIRNHIDALALGANNQALNSITNQRLDKVLSTMPSIYLGDFKDGISEYFQKQYDYLEKHLDETIVEANEEMRLN